MCMLLVLLKLMHILLSINGGWAWNSFMAAEGTKSTVNGIFVTLSSNHGYNLNTVQKSIWTGNNGKLWELENLESNTKIKFNRGAGNNAAQASTALPTTAVTVASVPSTCSSPRMTWM